MKISTQIIYKTYINDVTITMIYYYDIDITITKDITMSKNREDS